MKKSVRILTRASFLGLLLSFCSPVGSHAQTDVPPVFVGTWSGLVIQPDGVSFEAQVRIEAGHTDELVGRVDYPDYDCGGGLYLVESRGWQIVVRERLTYGTERCIDNGRILITRPDKNPAVMYEWSGSGVTATGVLEKRDR